MSKPDEAAHLTGKLLKYFGEERICWGTDSLWYGSPQDQIQAFRAFQISEQWQDRYGYPALTSNARQNIFGLNAAKVYGVEIPPRRQVSTTGGFDRLREQYREAPNPSFQTFGPRTRRQFLRLTGRSNGRQG